MYRVVFRFWHECTDTEFMYLMLNDPLPRVGALMAQVCVHECSWYILMCFCWH